jgi:drug/metabolite transporter (DMT)-like permease
MAPLLGYFLCLFALVPALSLEVFFGLLGKTTRQHEVLSILRMLLQLLTSVTSPVKIALATTVLLFGLAAESCWGRRIITVLVVGAAGFSSTLQMFSLGRAGLGVAAAMMFTSTASLVSISWGTRLLGTTPTC